MRSTAISSLVAIGIGAAAYSMTSKKNKRKMYSMFKPMKSFELGQIIDKKSWKKTKNRFSKMF
ncbi:DUF3918 family protein [Alkalihalobacillus trypoxylicola]|uniref:DUF3918 domain-containing protein n=1 Tax=Alkalihalobacillus trypoxylicola TaxID=519424 RepID=A0A161PGI6_9BACI|nr:DUF3918 family protein [Alkalihalobacillus trypoxylicola]KYG31894.1 hypothetical protein AZF04_03715 [Alkalihalobacillus trypoxylicola]